MLMSQFQIALPVVANNGGASILRRIAPRISESGSTIKPGAPVSKEGRFTCDPNS